jgi:hypothetical protein
LTVPLQIFSILFQTSKFFGYTKFMLSIRQQLQNWSKIMVSYSIAWGRINNRRTNAGRQLFSCHSLGEMSLIGKS